MPYTVARTVTVKNNRLIESEDLTRPLSAFIHGEHYLVVSKNVFTFSCLSLGRIFNAVTGLDLTQPISTGLNSLLTDLFVARYKNDTIPLKLVSGLYDRRLSVFNPLAYGDYEIYFTSVNTPDVKNDPKRKGTLDDLAIKSDEDMSNYLVAINGVFHRTVILGNVLYVMDGFRTIRLSGRKDIVIVDTKAVGGHKIVPMTKSNVSKPDYQKRAVVTTPSILGKSIFAVIDGYFYHRDHQVLGVVDSTHVSINTNKLPLIQQFRHNPRTLYKPDRFGVGASQSSLKYSDPYDAVFVNKTSLPVATLANKEFQHSRLAHYHSFLVVMNNPNLFTVATDVIPTGTPKLYQEVSKRPLSGMLNYGCGLCPSYLIWSDSFDRKSIFLSDQDYDVDRQDESINPSFIPALVTEHSQGVNLPAQFFDYVCA
jgi:hypothetical protein